MSTSTQRDWPTQLRLPGQAAAPEGPIDMQMMYLVHRGFRRDLARFATAVRHTPVEERRTWRLLAERWAIFAETGPGFKVLWWLTRRRFTTREERAFRHA